MSTELENYQDEEERREALEHRDVLLSIGSILKQPAGLRLFNYLFKYFDVAELPEEHLVGRQLYERMGILKAGNAIYKLACEADPTIAASILSKLEREKYEHLCERFRIEREQTS